MLSLRPVLRRPGPFFGPIYQKRMLEQKNEIEIQSAK